MGRPRARAGKRGDPSRGPPAAVPLLQRALLHHRAGRLDDAAPLYLQALAEAPDDADALHFHGMLLHQRGDDEGAVVSMRRSIAANGRVAGWHSNLGNVLQRMGRIDEARAAYQESLALAGDDPAPHTNLGVLLHLQGRHDEAEACYRRALARNPRYVEALNNLGNVLLDEKRSDEALEAYRKAAVIDPKQTQSRSLAARAFLLLGRTDEAVGVYRAWIAEEPENPYPVHQLAGVTGEAVPTRAADAYVANLFDEFAAAFDAKLASLDYRAPEQVAARVGSLLGAPDGTRDVLDAGCGTGLCGASLRPYARRLSGVDLSGEMLRRASRRGGYDALHLAELTAFLEAQPAAFDLVVSADTLCYFGRLDEVLVATHRSLRAGGTLVFTVEAIDAEGAERGANGVGFRLRAHGRYSHLRAYVEDALRAADFQEIALSPVVLRKEAGAPVAGLLASAAKREKA